MVVRGDGIPPQEAFCPLRIEDIMFQYHLSNNICEFASKGVGFSKIGLQFVV